MRNIPPYGSIERSYLNNGLASADDLIYHCPLLLYWLGFNLLKFGKDYHFNDARRCASPTIRKIDGGVKKNTTGAGLYRGGKASL